MVLVKLINTFRTSTQTFSCFNEITLYRHMLKDYLLKVNYLY